MSDEVRVWYHLVLDWPTVGKGFLAGAAYSLAAWVYRDARRRRQEAVERVQISVPYITGKQPRPPTEP